MKKIAHKELDFGWNCSPETFTMYSFLNSAHHMLLPLDCYKFFIWCQSNGHSVWFSVVDICLALKVRLLKNNYNHFEFKCMQQEI